MSTAQVSIERVGYAVIQDLGRPGLGYLGISANGAGDQVSARIANVLVGNIESKPLIEVIASELIFVAESAILICVTGAADSVYIDDLPHNTYETLAIPAGSRIRITPSKFGQRTYLAINGNLLSEKILNSASPDAFLEFSQRLSSGAKISIETNFVDSNFEIEFPVFRFAAQHRTFSNEFRLSATLGPDLERLKNGYESFNQKFEVLPQSDNVGMRLSGNGLDLNSAGEIMSRGVPIGAVEVPPSGELIILLRGRLVTAGYPVVAVLTRSSIDLVSQAMPGDQVFISIVDMESAKKELSEIEMQIRQLKSRVRNAFESRGWQTLFED